MLSVLSEWIPQRFRSYLSLNAGRVFQPGGRGGASRELGVSNVTVVVGRRGQFHPNILAMGGYVSQVEQPGNLRCLVAWYYGLMC